MTDDDEYAEMRSSFEAAGFRSPLAEFVLLRDRRSRNGSDPYELIGQIGSRASRPYVILVHQDVRLDQGAGVDELLAALEQLSELDPGWVVAGTAGGTSDLRIVRRLRDPHGGSSDDALPAPVVTLDENLLVFNRTGTPRCSPALSGFHLYGSDVCLNALKDGGTAYVVDLPVTHSSAGRLDESYETSRTQFLCAWKPRFFFTYIRTPNELLFLSRSRTVRRLVDAEPMRRWVRAWGIERSAQR